MTTFIDPISATLDPASARQRAEIAQALGVAEEQVRVVSMGETFLQQGVLVDLSIETWSGKAALRPEHLGLPEATNKGVLRLGTLRLLPDSLYGRLHTVASNARDALYGVSFKTHWGWFVPSTAYEQWRAANDDKKAKVFALRDYLVSNWDSVPATDFGVIPEGSLSIKEQVAADYRPIATTAYANLTALVAKIHTQMRARQDSARALDAACVRAGLGPDDSVGLASVLDLTPDAVDKIRAEAPRVEIPASGDTYLIQYFAALGYPSDQAGFVEEFVGRILDLMPAKEELEASFTYREELSFVPLFAQLGTQRAEEREAEMEARQAERELRVAEASLRTEQTEAERAVARMQEDVARQAREHKVELIDGFLKDVVVQLRSLVYEATTDVLESINKNGKLGGSSVRQLTNLIDRVGALNFVGDDEVSRSMDELRGLLGPTPDERNVPEINARLRDIATVTRSTLIALNQNPRSARSLGVADIPSDAMVQSARRGLGLTLDEALPPEIPVARRSPRQMALGMEM